MAADSTVRATMGVRKPSVQAQTKAKKCFGRAAGWPSGKGSSAPLVRAPGKFRGDGSINEIGGSCFRPSGGAVGGLAEYCIKNQSSAMAASAVSVPELALPQHVWRG